MIKIVYGDKLIDIAQGVIKNIDSKNIDLFEDNIVVVPDRFSLVAEKLIFSTLNIKSTFNIRVMGITTLARKIISSCVLSCVYADSEESQLILYRAMQKCKDEFLCFSKHLTQGLCQKVQNSLSLIRSSNIDSKELLSSVESFDVGVRNKFHDLAIINDKYDELLDSRLDGTNTLKLFSTIINQNAKLDKTNFFFCGFDAFTKQGYEIIDAISRNCKNLTIGVFKSRNKNNGYLFDEEVYETIKGIFEKNDTEFVEEECRSVFSLGQKQLFENVFGYKINPDNNYKYSYIYEMSTKHDEVNFVAKQISYLTKNKNVKYSDICVATCEDYFDEIENVFSDYNISFYKDSSHKLYDTEFCNYVRYALLMLTQNYDKESILNFLTNSFVQIDKDEKCDIINFIYENNIEYKNREKLYEKCDIFKKYCEFLDNFNEYKTIKQIICGINKMISNFDVKQKLDDIIQNISDDLLTQKLYIQILDKFDDLNEKIINSLGDEEITIQEFFDFYFNVIKDIKISQVPLSCDSVYVGDCSSSFFEKTKYVFIVGANQDIVPGITKDLGLIPDKDIDKLAGNLNISPTVKMINKRNKFKAFDILTNAQEKLYITYRIADEESKKMLCSQFVSNILKINGNSNLYKQATLEEIYADDELNKLQFNNPNIKIAKLNISPTNRDSALLKKAVSKIENLPPCCEIDRTKIKYQNKILNNNKTKISQIESYYDCPFAHFVKYGLKLQERKDGELKPNDFGNFIHKFCEFLCRKYKSKLGTYKDAEITDVAKNEFNQVIGLQEFEYFAQDDNYFVKRLLENECIRIAKFINLEQSCSLFKIDKCEYSFGKDTDAITMSVDNENFSIVGFVDRFDVYDDGVAKYFRIIDYKTGGNAGKDAGLDKLFYGNKIQVYVYLKALQNKLGYIPFGAFYLPLANKLENSESDDEKGSYKLKGRFVGNLGLVFSADKTLCMQKPKSELFDVVLSYDKDTGLLKDKCFNKRSSKNVSEEQMKGMLEYSLTMVKNAITDILGGNIKASPIEGQCEFCKYSSICAKEVSLVKERKGLYKVDDDSFGGDENE